MNATCQERVFDEFRDRMLQLQVLWNAYCNDPEEYTEYGMLDEYGLSFDYVLPNTFNDQLEGYFRYQLSWGGPSDEFRIYADPVSEWEWSIYRIEYWFLDWFDGASIVLEGRELEFMNELIASYFGESGWMTHQYEKRV